MKMRNRLTAVFIAVMMLAAMAGGSALAADNYDTMADWDLKIAVPDGAEGVYDGSDGCYYIYTQNPDSIPYVMVTTYAYDSVDEFIPEFTAYMQSIYSDLQVTREAAPATIGGTEGVEIEYGYTISDYDATDRRFVMEKNGIIYMFASKEVEELGMTVGDAFTEVIAESSFLGSDVGGAGGDTISLPELDEGDEDESLANAYLYCLDNGMPKYWIDFTGAMADGIVLHCYFRSSDPTFYETWFILDVYTADFTDDEIVIHDVCDHYGLDHSDWFKSFVLRLEGDSVVMEVERDESTLAGGEEDNILTGEYVMEPVAVGITYEYYQEDGMLKYWLDMGGEDVTLYGMFRSGDPEFYEDEYTLDWDTAEWDGYTLRIHKVYNSAGMDVSSWFESLTLSDVQGAILMNVERDESTLAGGEEDNILTGVYMFEPRTYLILEDDG